MEGGPEIQKCNPSDVTLVTLLLVFCVPLILLSTLGYLCPSGTSGR